MAKVTSITHTHTFYMKRGEQVMKRCSRKNRTKYKQMETFAWK